VGHEVLGGKLEVVSSGNRPFGIVTHGLNDCQHWPLS